jgi:hypothetical protein
MRAGTFRAAAAAALAVAVTGPIARAEPGTTERIRVHVRCVDAATGRPTPAMVCIRNLDADTVHLPPDGRVYDGRGTLAKEFFTGFEFDADPNWIGPIRKMNGVGDNHDRSFVYELRPSIPYWKEPFAYQTSGDFTIMLAPGRYRLAVDHGMEYVPLFDDFAVERGPAVEKIVTLKRWVDLPAAGWYSGDVHVHHPSRTEGQRAFLIHYARAVDLHVVNLLEMGHHKGTDFKQAGFGPKFRYVRGPYALVSGQEDPRSTYGHIIGLNTRSLVRTKDMAKYDLYDLVFRQVHEQGGVVGYAHQAWNGCAFPRGFPWYVTTGEIDFVELLQFNTINQLDYYDFLNLGFKLTAAAGSDMPWGSSMGEVRTYVYTGPKFDVDAWFAGLKQGHTFVSNGPVIEATVDGMPPGNEINKCRGETINVAVKAYGHPVVGLPTQLTLVTGNGTYRQVEGRGTRDAPLRIDVKIPLPRSTWLAASTRCENGAVAHTSPFYMLVDGEPFWHPTLGPAIIEKQFAAMKIIRDELADVPDADRRATGVRERLDRAERFYKDLAAKMAAAAHAPAAK